MPAKLDFWNLGAQFMAKIQARDLSTAQRQLDQLLRAIAGETQGHFSYLKLRTLQVLTNANRAAFSVGASAPALHAHSGQIVATIDTIQDERQLVCFAQKAVRKTIGLVPSADAYRHRKIDEAVKFIQKNYALPIGRREVAERLHCSPAHFSRLFAQSTGQSYVSFILRCRLEKAKDLLQNSHLNVAEIASAVGYADPFQFSKIFRKKIGVSPREYRRMNISLPGAGAGPSLAPAPGQGEER